VNKSFIFLRARAGIRARLVVLGLCAGLSLLHPACAQPEQADMAQAEPVADARAASPSPGRLGLPRRLAVDTGYILGAPARWDAEDWQRAGWMAGAILGAGLLLDRPVHDATQRHPHSALSRLARRFEPLGTGAGSALVLAGFYAWGMYADDPRAVDVAQDGLVASLIASGLIEPALKAIVGRSRPSANLGSGHFQPFSKHAASFPSGHSTQAFAMATVIATHYADVEWVPYAAYGAAALVGVSRIYKNAHFTSDVLAGAAIGILVGKGVVGIDRRRSDGSGYSIAPAITGRGLGLAFHASF
jgi:membrane-associated phospholipid phosphatase